MSVNKVILIGRLGKDPELKYTPGGSAVCNFSLATNRQWTGQNGQKSQTTTWHNIVAWGKQAEVMKEYLQKGREVYIEGRIDNRSYEDKDGNKRYVSEVVVERFQFVGSRTDTDMPVSEPSEDGPSPAAGGSEEEDDLPF